MTALDVRHRPRPRSHLRALPSWRTRPAATGPDDVPPVRYDASGSATVLRNPSPATVAFCSELTPAEVEAGALRVIARQVARLLAMPRHSLPPHQAEEVVRVALAAMAHITSTELRSQAVAGLRRCARRHRSYLAELRAQAWLARVAPRSGD